MLVTHLYEISCCISSTHATDELNSVQFREARAASPFSYTHMPLEDVKRRHVILVYIQPYPISYALLGSQGNTVTDYIDHIYNIDHIHRTDHLDHLDHPDPLHNLYNLDYTEYIDHVQ